MRAEENGHHTRVVHWLTLATIFMVAILLRVIAIDSQGLWTDEALTIPYVNWSLRDMLLLPTDPTPFLYYAVHKLLLSAHSSVAAIRSISAVAGVVSVGVMYLLGRVAFGPTGGLLAAALLAVWSIHVDYSQEARAYSVLFLLTLLPSLGLIRYAQLVSFEASESDRTDSRDRRLALGLFCIGNVLSFYTHVASVFWITLTCLLLIAIAGPAGRTPRRELLSVLAIMALCAAPGIYRLVLQMHAGDVFQWLRQPSLVKAASTSAEVFLPVGVWDNPLATSFGLQHVCKIVAIIASVALAGAAFSLGWRRELRRRPTVLLLILAYLAVPVIVWLFGFVARPLFLDRVIMYSIAGMILLITGLCIAFGEQIAATAGTVCVLLYGGSTLVVGTMRQKEDWRGAYAYLAEHASAADIIAVCPFYNYPSLRYHATAPVGTMVLAVDPEGSLAVVEEGLGANPDWDKTYFHGVLVPRVLGQHDTARSAHEAGKLRLRPGQSVWRVDGHCGAALEARMAAMLRGIDPHPESAWVEARKAPRSVTTIRRYRVVRPIALDIRRLPLPGSLPSQRDEARQQLPRCRASLPALGSNRDSPDPEGL